MAGFGGAGLLTGAGSSPQLKFETNASTIVSKEASSAVTALLSLGIPAVFVTGFKWYSILFPLSHPLDHPPPKGHLRSVQGTSAALDRHYRWMP